MAMETGNPKSTNKIYIQDKLCGNEEANVQQQAIQSVKKEPYDLKIETNNLNTLSNLYMEKLHV